MILYWDRSGITDKTVNVNRPDIVQIDREIKTAFAMDIAVPLNHYIPKTEAQKITK
jgi:hypothetical protein